MNTPLWHRPVRWFLGRQLKRTAGQSPCSTCGEAIPTPENVTDDLWDMLIICPHCGHSRSVLSLMNTQAEEPALPLVSRLPDDSPIEFVSTPQAERWVIPGKRGFNFIYFFAVFWLVITIVVSWSFLVGDHYALGWGKIGMISFFGLFYAVGIGLLYTALCVSFTKHEIEIADGSMRYRRRMFGRNKQLEGPLISVLSVELTEFYQQNYKPVHGIEIRGAQGKIRFGSQLSLEEKQVLVAQMAKALMPEARRFSAETSPATEGNIPAPTDAQRAVNIEEPGRWHPVLIAGGGIGLLVTGFMLTQGLHMFRDLVGGDVPTTFSFVSGAFMVFWSMGPFVGIVVSLGALLLAWRFRHTDRFIEITRSSVQLTQRTRTRTLVNTWNIQDLRHAAIVQIGTVNGAPKWRGEVHVGTRSIGFGSGRSKTELENLKHQINAMRLVTSH